MLISYKNLLHFSNSSFKKIKSDKYTSIAVSEGLCNASLRGVDSHGIRLLPHYLNSGILGRKNIRPKFTIKKKYSSSFFLNADDGYGLAACKKALEYSTKKADKYGITSIGVTDSSHCGCLASSVIPFAKKGYLIFGFTHADSLLKSSNSPSAFFGTNPICFAAPRGSNRDPFCLDMSPSVFSWNKLLTYRASNKKLPSNVAADKNGKMTRDPNKAISLMPIGDYKGYGLSAFVEVLCAILNGLNYGKNIPPMFTYDLKKQRKIGQFFIVIKSDINQSKSQFINALNRMYRSVYNEPSTSKNKSIQLPNDKESLEKNKRLKLGIPVNKILIKELNEIAIKLNIKKITDYV